MRKLSTDEFIAKARLIHGNKYDYSITVYNGRRKTFQAICKKHGVFTATAGNHLRGAGCPLCGIDVFRKMVSGVGVNNTAEKVFGTKAYEEWKSMLHRCYDEKQMGRHKSYSECSVCEEWKDFSNFKKWYDKNGVDGWALDKDIIIKGNKIYSPDTCAYIPKPLNSLLVNRRAERGELPLGVTRAGSRYRARYSRNRKEVLIGTFDSPEEAFLAYKIAKEAYIKEVAQEYFDKGLVDKRVYDALMQYEIEITD